VPVGSPGKLGRRKVRHRQQDQLPADRLRLDLANQLRHDDLAFVFVAVVAGHHEHDRPFAVADRRDRNRQPAIRGAMHGMRQAQIARVLALRIEVDFAMDRISVGRGSGHGGIVR